jgi:tetratricopeptide (TPR) repeat protein
MNEHKYNQAVKYLEMALRTFRLEPEFNLAMGECMVKLGKSRESVHYFITAVQSKPRNLKNWEALLKTLFDNEQYEDALSHYELADQKTGHKSSLKIYKSAILIAQGKIKEGIICLENILSTSPRHLKDFLKLYPASIKYPQVVEVIIKFKRRKGGK